VSRPPEWSRVKAVFHAALEQTPAVRDTFVANACGSDMALRQEVESLLCAHDAAGDFAREDALAGLTTAALHELSTSDAGLAPGSRLGIYDIVDFIGRGSMGQVFKAVDPRLGRTVALKVLTLDLAPDPSSRSRFQREARTIASLNHPHICTLFDVDHGGPIDYLVMEYLEGETLADRLRRGPIPLESTRRYATEIIQALDAAHSQGVVHRDLKPSNVMLTSSGTKLLDFGLAKLLEPRGGGESSSVPSAEETGQGAVVGTAGYMSPEQARGQPVDTRTDIWAFGCLLFEMLTGRPAFTRDSVAETLAAVLDHEPDWGLVPVTTPRSLVRVMRRCLQKDPVKRLRDIADALEDLDEPELEIAGHQATSSRSRMFRFVPWAIAAGAMVVAAITATRSDRAPAPAAAPLRLSILAPEGMTLAPLDVSGAPQFALSPDARQMVLVVADAARVARLWIRPLDSTSGRMLAGTEHASAPFWSWDGSAIGFFADRKLKKVSLQSGLVQELADAALDVPGGDWSPSGTILFNGPGRTLLQISENGGPATAATEVDASVGEVFHRWPQFLPDGRRFLFHIRCRDGKRSGAYIGSLDTPGHRLVVASAARPIYAAGRLLFERDGNLIAQPFDPVSATLSGQPVALPDRVVALNAAAWLPVSAAADAIAYWSGDGRPTFDLDLVDRAGRVLQHVLPSGQYTALDLSPDAARALVTERTGQQDVLSMVDLRTGDRSRVTLAPGVAHFGVWAPDRRQVVFSSLENGVPHLYRTMVAGNDGDVAIVPSISHPNMFPTGWSPDGQWLLYTAPGGKAWDVFAVRLADSHSRPVVAAPRNQIQARLSYNGRWIAYASDESGRFEIYVQSFEDGTGKVLVSSHGGSQPAWRQDGRELFYVAADGTMIAVAVSSGARFEHGTETALFATRSPEVLAPFVGSYAVSADGSRFLLRSASPGAPPPTVTVVVNGQARTGQ
jgi:serine/threonine protein kinase/Tol biopolymer transport system component